MDDVDWADELDEDLFYDEDYDDFDYDYEDEED